MTHTLSLTVVLLAAAWLAMCIETAPAAEGEFNYDESKVPQYTLPDPLRMEDGRRVTSADMWRTERRPELLALFRSQVYGQRPPKPDGITYDVVESTPAYLAGKATRKDVRVLTPPRDGSDQAVRLLEFTLITPHSDRPVPAFVGVLLFDVKADSPVPGKPLDADVGVSLPGEQLLQAILDRGYAIATFDPDSIAPDNKDTYRQGALDYLYPDRSGYPAAEEPGALATWAWGLSRVLDYLETDSAIDARRVAVVGHSRRGKTALWAGAEDERFAIVISNNSGCGGAALSRRRFGETVARINRVFPHWFCDNFNRYNDREDDLPIDQHQLVALAAPRPVYVASAVEDGWADPKGEFLAARGAQPVYELFGLAGLGTDEQPPLNQSAGQHVGYHVRSGKHALSDFDWLHYLDFADRHFGKNK